VAEIEKGVGGVGCRLGDSIQNWWIHPHAVSSLRGLELPPRRTMEFTLQDRPTMFQAPRRSKENLSGRPGALPLMTDRQFRRGCHQPPARRVRARGCRGGGSSCPNRRRPTRGSLDFRIHQHRESPLNGRCPEHPLPNKPPTVGRKEQTRPPKFRSSRQVRRQVAPTDCQLNP